MPTPPVISLVVVVGRGADSRRVRTRVRAALGSLVVGLLTLPTTTLASEPDDRPLMFHRSGTPAFDHVPSSAAASGVSFTPATTKPTPITTEPSAEPAPEPATESTPSPSPAPSFVGKSAERRSRWAACIEEVTPCIRPRPARALLLSLGAVSAGLMFGLGDRLTQSDPAVLLAGLGGLAGAGALTGALAGRLSLDGATLPDRLRPSTASLAYDYRGPLVLDEARPHTMSLRFAPNLFLPSNHGRLRLFGHVGGWLNPKREVDPRPQFNEVPAGQQGTAPSVQRQRNLSLGIGFDMAVNLPYPVLSRSARLGAAELRYRPEVQVRRDRYDPGTPDSHLVERTMLLPLTIGARWHLSPRQRFTAYFGPRFDFLAFSDPGSDALRRGGAQIGPLYAEAWYDIDVPLTPARNDGRTRSLIATGQLSLGYIHSRFDGQGFNLGPIIGFMGPLHVGWQTRLRPVGSPVAAQLGAFARIGNGTTLGLELGIVAPDPTLRRRSSR